MTWRLGPMLAVLVCVGCSTVPGTGRSRVDFISDAKMHQLGRQAFDAVQRERSTVESGPDVHRVRRITDRVVEAARQLYPDSPLPEQWEVLVIEDSDPNAFAVPGGGIGVHTGMIELAGSDDALAVVIGHEVAHVLARHAAERMSHGLLVSGSMVAASVVLEDDDPMVLAGLGLGATYGVVLPYSRLHETEADELGLMITAQAGYDPRTAIGLWERMASQGGGRVEFLSTHPAPRTRIDRLRLMMPDAVRCWRIRTAGQP